MARPILFLTVGLPGTGKTTEARRIEVEQFALRLTKDEWMKGLYGFGNPSSASDVIEGRLIDIALRALELGVNVVVDYGLRGRDERSALRQAATDLGAAVQLRYFDVTPAEQRKRLDQRHAEEPHTTWHMSDAELAEWMRRAPYLNKIRREAKAAVTPEIVKRDSTGKPVLVGNQRLGYFEVTPAGCACACVSNGHDPSVCTGQQQFKIGGRPGSGFVDHLAKELGREPIPEQVVARQEDCYVLVVATLAWWLSLSNEEKLARETELESRPYDDLINLLCDVLTEQRPDLITAEPYAHLKANLKKLVKFRNKIAHSRPLSGDYYTRLKRVKGVDVQIHITPEELAEYLDLSVALQSQLSFIPIYLAQKT